MIYSKMIRTIFMQSGATSFIRKTNYPNIKNNYVNNQTDKRSQNENIFYKKLKYAGLGGAASGVLYGSCFYAITLLEKII